MYILNFFRIICYINFTLTYTPIGGICFFLHVTMETAANK